MKVKLNVPEIRENYVENLLKYYGVEDVKQYLKPTDSSLQDPSNLDNIEEGAELLLKVCKSNGKILLIVDSDADGYTSSSIIYMYLKKIFPELQIDWRLHKGKQHGLEDHINWLENNCIYDLIILPDSSSNDKDYHDRLLQYGAKCLVLDHHIVDKGSSDNAIIINNQSSSKYKNKELTGAGIVYQFCRYLDKKLNINYADNFIDLTALGICGDMGSLREIENRYILLKGFKKENIQNLFFKTLIAKQSYSMNNKITPISVAFYIVPLINAMIRVGEMPEKERLFRAFIDGSSYVPSGKRGAKGQMELLAIESTRECTNAKNRQNKIKEEMVEILSKKIISENLNDNKILVVELEDDMNFPSELNGLVCMNLVSKFKKPALIGRVNTEGFFRGSIRGLNNSNLESFKDFLEESNLFEYIQGWIN